MTIAIYMRTVRILWTLIISVALVGFVGFSPIISAEDTALPASTTSTTEPTDVAPTIEPQIITDSAQGDAPQLPPDTTSQQITPDTPEVQQAEVTVDLAAESTLNNDSAQSATTGDATIVSNDTAGNAATGDTANELDIFNLSNNNQSLSATPGNPLLYINNIQGNANGDIVIDPVALGQPIPSSSVNAIAPLYLSKDTITIIATNTINNNADMISQTGDATIDSNDTAGNATTGDATNNADIINIANTIIGTGSYFVGILNIYGDFQGNIIIPASLINALAGNGDSQANYENLNIANATNITNNSDMSALSGDAALSGNDNVGSATTGDAMNTISIQNYSGQHIFSGNTLLIIVNVMGQWLGLLLGSSGSHTATISGASTNGYSPPDNGLALSISTITNITNNLNMNAKSGNATITNNDRAGNAITGNAFNTARILNISNTVVNLSDWFGVLYINILGNWYGSVVTPFSIDPEIIPQQATNTTNTPTNTSTAATSPTLMSQFNRFGGIANAKSNTQNVTPAETKILGIDSDAGITAVPLFARAQDNAASSMYWLALIGIFGASAFGANQAYRLRIR